MFWGWSITLPKVTTLWLLYCQQGRIFLGEKSTLKGKSPWRGQIDLFSYFKGKNLQHFLGGSTTSYFLGLTFLRITMSLSDLRCKSRSLIKKSDVVILGANNMFEKHTALLSNFFIIIVIRYKVYVKSSTQELG